MPTEDPRTTLEIRSLVKASGEIELSLFDTPVPEPKPHEVVVRIEASPINPSDLGVLLAGANPGAAIASGTKERPILTARVPEGAMGSLAARLGQSLPVGNEGAGVVVATGSSPEAKALAGKTVATIGGGMYTRYRCLPAAQCMPLPAGTAPAAAASWFVNPMTALGMVETMRREGHTALVHTAAASNLGQMLNRICLADGVGLVNVVRKKEQEELLRALGAKHVVSSSVASFDDDLTEAIAATGATIAFDAIGGGTLAGRILSSMETALLRKATRYNPYGSATHKQVYVYGMLDRAPIELARDFGMAWGVGGWLLTPFLARIGADDVQKLKERVVRELGTTFASHYTKEVPLAAILDRDELSVFAAQSTGAKYLVRPQAP